MRRALLIVGACALQVLLEFAHHEARQPACLLGPLEEPRPVLLNELVAALGYYRKLELRPPKYLKNKISIDTVCFAGTDDPILTPGP